MIDEVIEKLSVLKLHGISRTGVVAGFKGDKKLNNLNDFICLVTYPGI